MTILLKAISSTLIILTLASCSKGFFKKVDTRETPVNAQERARKNVEEGRGISIGGLMKKGRGTNYEFSTSNPLWRASLEILDFLPMTTVDYSGGMIISDWYTDNNSLSESIKITVRFLDNEVRSESLKIIVHKKICKSNSSCSVKILTNSAISKELKTTIIRKAALLEKESKEKKKK
jgi:hypothetical protein|tara:strand:+ start:421 stop:954 length:534 start_codon:yes stop_codon:yes gene_type:complete